MIVCVIFLALGALLIIPIPFSVLGHVSLLPRTFGGLSARVLGKSVFAARMNICSNELIFTTAAGKRTVFKLSLDTSDDNSIASSLDNGILRVLNLRRVECYIVLGVESNAMSTAMAVAGARASIGALSAYLCTRFTGLSFRDYYEPVYDMDKTEISFQAKAAMSLVDIIYSFCYAVIRKIIRGAKIYESHNA